jgi:hypothetical protein
MDKKGFRQFIWKYIYHMLAENECKKPKEYSCLYCNHITSNKNKHERHLLTRKHILNKNLKDNVRKNQIEFLCSNCDKIYKSRVGLWQHNKKCCQETNKNIIVKSQEQVIDTTLVLELIKQNKELQNLLVQQANDHKTTLVEQSKEKSELINKLVDREPGSNNINSNNTTNNNQKFNLNFFLNETCKDAMNLQEFIDNICITFQDLLKIGNDGFVTGVSDIFIKELRDLDVNKRPIHCTDSKRETIYLKENDAWNKHDRDNKKLKDVIEKIEYKNVAALHQWCQDNPDSKINNSSNNLLRDKIYLQTLQGDETTREKIIKNISKEVIIEK